MRLPIYMDYHATTPVDPRVLDAMMPILKEDFGNPASRNHTFGLQAEKKVEQAREQTAALLGAQPEEIVFTSGATEANNLALKGIAEVYGSRGDHIVSQVTEHKSVLDTLAFLKKKGFKVTLVGVDRQGRVLLEELKQTVTSRTILISVMMANNEIGTIQPVEAIAKVAKERGIFFHVDASQAVGRIPIDVEKMGIDLLSFSGHKMYAPKGIGALYVRRKNPHVRLQPLLHGGGHEGGLRSGTLNVPGIVGLGQACKIAQQEMDADRRRIGALRDRLWKGLESRLGDIFLNGHPTERLYNNLHLSFAGVDAEGLLVSMADAVAVSSGSACSTGVPEPSYVLRAIGVPELLIHSSVRFGLGRFNTEEEVDYVIERVTAEVNKLRRLSPFYEPKTGTS